MHKVFQWLVAKDLTGRVFFPILRCLSGMLYPEWGGSGLFGVVELEGNYLQSWNKVRRNGTEERPEWGASPAKPSKPLRTEAKRVVLLLGVRTEFLAGCISGFAVDLSALDCALVPFCLRALREPRKILRAIEGRLCRRFRN